MDEDFNCECTSVGTKWIGYINTGCKMQKRPAHYMHFADNEPVSILFNMRLIVIKKTIKSPLMY